MKNFIALILFLSFTPNAFGQQPVPDNGFTKKADAKNLIVNGLKEGKWVEYYLNSGDTSQPFYSLGVYHLGALTGIVRYFYSDGLLYEEAPYKNGKKNGMLREYDWKGDTVLEAPYSDDKENGVEKYYENRKLRRETIFLNDTSTSVKMYNQNIDATKRWPTPR